MSTYEQTIVRLGLVPTQTSTPDVRRIHRRIFACVACLRRVQLAGAVGADVVWLGRWAKVVEIGLCTYFVPSSRRRVVVKLRFYPDVHVQRESRSSLPRVAHRPPSMTAHAKMSRENQTRYREFSSLETPRKKLLTNSSGTRELPDAPCNFRNRQRRRS